MKRRILTKMLIGALALLPLYAAAFSWRDFFGRAADDVEGEASEGVMIENDISVSAGTGGNSASGSSSSRGGSVTTGNARASATIQTSVGDDDFEDIRIEVETEGEPAVVERSVATSSGRIHVQTSVRVEVGATSSGSAAGARLESEDSEDVAEQTEKGDVFEDEDDEEIGTTTRANISELSGRNQERLRGLFRRLFGRLFSLFNF